MNLPMVINNGLKTVKNAGKVAKVFCITHKSELMLGGGITCYIVSEVTACKATLKASDLMDELDTKVALLPTDVANTKTLKDGSIVVDEDKVAAETKRLKREYKWRIAKGYVIPVLLGCAGIGGCVGSHVLISNELANQAAATAALAEGWRIYRQRVVKAYGTEMDDRFMTGNIECCEINAETGEQKTYIDQVDSLGPCDSTYSRLFGPETSRKWVESAAKNMDMLKWARFMANDTLNSRGWIFFDEVLDFLDLPIEEGDHDVGWVKLSPATKISFGYEDPDDPMKEAFRTGWESTIWLDFNVQGDIRYIFSKEFQEKKQKGWLLE